MDAVAIRADGLVGRLVRMLLLEQGYGGAVEVGDVAVEDVRGDAVLLHERGVAVAPAADVRRLQAESGRSRVFLGVCAVAVGADGHVGVAASSNAEPWTLPAYWS